MERSAVKWQGMADDQPDPRFVKYKSIEYGFRAAARNLLTYSRRAWNTVAEICEHWAPRKNAAGVVENDTEKYIADVCGWTGFDRDEILDLDNCQIMLPLLRAMARKEQGKIYPDRVILDGMRMAGVHDVKPRALIKQPSGQAATVATIGGAVAGAAEIARQVREVQDTVTAGTDFIAWLASYGPWVAVGLVVAGGVGVLVALYLKQKRMGV